MCSLFASRFPFCRWEEGVSSFAASSSFVPSFCRWEESPLLPSFVFSSIHPLTFYTETQGRELLRPSFSHRRRMRAHFSGRRRSCGGACQGLPWCPSPLPRYIVVHSPSHLPINQLYLHRPPTHHLIYRTALPTQPTVSSSSTYPRTHPITLQPTSAKASVSTPRALSSSRLWSGRRRAGRRMARA